MASPHPFNGADPNFRVVKNIIFVGDPGIGKTTVIHRLLGLIAPNVPDSFKYTSDFDICDKKFRIQVMDIPGSLRLASGRSDMYEFAHTVVLCFAIDNLASFRMACDEWLAKTNLCVPGKPKKVLVGLKKDLRNDPSTIARLQRRNMSPVSIEAAISEKERLGFDAYVECSSLTSEGMLDVFRTCLVNVRNFQR